MDELFLRLLRKRGVSQEFLYPKYEECFDPFLLPDMDKAVERIREAVENKERILIFGDYDVDGVTATTVMFDALKLAGADKIFTMLPDRFLDGYGMSKKIVQRAKDEKIGLVVTVDCGSANGEIIDELVRNGVSVVVTDHHECLGELPKAAVAVVNPKRGDREVVKDLRDLAGVGVAFEVARALVRRGMIAEGQEKWLLDLALIGTICDSVPMTLENRRICYFGLKVLRKTRRLGLKELLKVAGVTALNSGTIGYLIGPRLNAAGRMSSPDKALGLLMTQSRTEAAKMAKELNDLNIIRKTQQKQAIEEIEQRGISEGSVIVEFGDWHEGILGIIAGKLTEKYKKPAFVLARMNGEMKGSGRSFGEFSLAEAIQNCGDVIISGGGHAAACGVKVAEEKIEEFRKRVNDFYDSLGLVDQERFLELEADLEIFDLNEVSLDFAKKVQELGPFGEGNEEPILLLSDVYLLETKRLGTKDEHIRLHVKGKEGGEMKIVSFFAPEEWLKAFQGQRGDIWIRVDINEWKGARGVEGRIVKMRLDEKEIF